MRYDGLRLCMMMISSSHLIISSSFLRCDLPSPDGCQEVCGWQAEGLTGR